MKLYSNLFICIFTLIGIFSIYIPAEHFDLPHSVKCNFGLDNLELKADSFNSRIWMNSQILEFHIVKNKLKCTLINFRKTSRLLEKNKGIVKYGPGPVYFETILLDTSLSLIAFNIAEKYQLFDSKDAPEQGHGIDGYNYDIEVRKNNNYFYHSYWCPGDSKEPQQLEIYQSVNQIKEIFDLNFKYRTFLKSLPDSIYHKSFAFKLFNMFVNKKELNDLKACR